MTTLFTTAEKDIKDQLESLSIEDIHEMADSDTFFKGKQYYEWELIDEAQYSFDKFRLSARVHGSREYDVLFDLQEGILNASCTCPAENMCKHIITALLYASQSGDEIEIGEDRGEGSPLHQHLMTLSKEELVSLVLDYAPEEYLLEIHNRYVSDSEALAIYHRAKAAINNLFSNTELLYSPDEFSIALEKQINRLLGLEHQLQDRLGELILNIILEVEKASSRGYLYDEERNTYFVQPEVFDRLLIQYSAALPHAPKARFLEQLDVLLNDATTDTFDHLLVMALETYKKEELPELKQVLLKNYPDMSISLTEEYYELLRSLLSDSEKETILRYLKEEDSIWLLELAELYQQKGREADAIEEIRTALAADPQMYGEEHIYMLYLDLLSAQGLQLDAVCLDALNCCASSSLLEKIEAVCSGDPQQYERILEKENPQEMLEYLEKNERLSEAIKLLKSNNNIWDHYRHLFFKKHKNEFPEDAVQYFCEVIDNNLQHTDNTHYHAINEALKQIKQVDEHKAASIANNIRATYNHRHNLMNLVEGF